MMQPIATVLLLGVLALGALPAAAEPLPVARDFKQDTLTAGAHPKPVLVFFTADFCPYCQQVEELYLRPLHARGDYGGKILMRVVHSDSHRTLRDFDGRQTDHESFARREGGAFTPVVRLYAPDGRELAPALRGYSSPDLYLGMLEQAIETSIVQLRSKSAAAK
jgi:thiol-disulfide isomerase/thioredoxin